MPYPYRCFVRLYGIPPRSFKASKNLGERSEPFNVGYTIFSEIRTRSLYALSETAPLRTLGTPAKEATQILCITYNISRGFFPPKFSLET